MRTLRTSFGSCSTQWPFVSLVGIPATAYMHFVRPNASVFIAANSPTTRRYVATHKSSFASGVRGNPDFPHRYCIIGGIGLPDPVWLRGLCRDSSALQLGRCELLRSDWGEDCPHTRETSSRAPRGIRGASRGVVAGDNAHTTRTPSARKCLRTTGPCTVDVVACGRFCIGSVDGYGYMLARARVLCKFGAHIFLPLAKPWVGALLTLTCRCA